MLTMIETVRKKFMKRILSIYEAAVSWESNVPPKINRRLQKAQKEGRYLDPLRCGEYKFEISDGNRQFIVELDKRTCHCGIWKAAYLSRYSNNIHAIPDDNLWPNGNFETVLPPIRRRGAGRPKLSRNKGSNEPIRVQRSIGFRCGICGSSSTHPEATGAASTHTEPDSTHPRHASTHAGHATRTNLDGSSTIAASPRISGTVTRVLLFIAIVGNCFLLQAVVVFFFFFFFFLTAPKSNNRKNSNPRDGEKTKKTAATRSATTPPPNKIISPKESLTGKREGSLFRTFLTSRNSGHTQVSHHGENVTHNVATTRKGDINWGFSYSTGFVAISVLAMVVDMV
ncbi:hypothetical protein EZV62_021623 [Acer yangbiense]|uniref:SWIM-type domain-containing protein n=1 Tax=Acer yangbiense TaxID=1000413 RepID=A0A5C7H644_9ROSI|nr:hypothetical protein EZV62_021623 [Acer yangbiense]